MPVVCDFNLVLGDTPVTIGDNNPSWSKNFNTGGRHASAALLIFNIRGLTHATTSAEVKINGIEVGRIHPYSLANDAPNPDIHKHWFTQMIAIDSNTLNNGDNQILINAVGYPNNPSDDSFDDFQLKDIVCFFHQRA